MPTTKKLKQLIEIAGLNITVLAERSGVSRRTIQYWIYRDASADPERLAGVWDAAVELARDNRVAALAVESKLAEVGIEL